MRITILTDNRTLDDGRFRTEHGLAVLLETADKQILLDTGASSLFLENAARLGFDLSTVDYVFLSHGHADHTGGLAAFLQENPKAKVIVSPAAVSKNFYSRKGALHPIKAGWPFGQMEGRTLYVRETQRFADGFSVIAAIPQHHPLPQGNRNLLVRQGDGFSPDSFDHEMAFYVDGFLFTGCAHNGLENILEACPWPVRTVLGGFHLLDAQGGNAYESEAELTALARRLGEKYPQVTFYTGHCTGDASFRTLKIVLGKRLAHFYCGEKIDID